MKRLGLLIVCFLFMVVIWAAGVGQAALASRGGESAEAQEPQFGTRAEVGQPNGKPGWPAIQNPSGKWAPQFPRPGALKILETDEVMVWDDYETSYELFHKHLYDTVVVDVFPAPDMITDVNGKVSVEFNRLQALHPLDIMGRTRYVKAGWGPHSESALELVPAQRNLFIELKKTIPADAAQWSTDPTGSKTSMAFPLFDPPRPAMLPTVNPTQKKWPSLSAALEAAAAIKTIDNPMVTVWDETLTRTQHSLRKIIRDVVVVQIWDGYTTLINGEGAQEVKVPRGYEQMPMRKMPSVFYLKAGTGPYSQAAVDPRHPIRTVWIELKGTEAPDCKTWSTDPACK